MDYRIICFRGHYAIIDEFNHVQVEVDNYREAEEELRDMEENYNGEK